MTAPALQVLDRIPRDGYQRPLVVPPGKVKAVGYTRCTTYVGCLEDRYALQQWAQRMTAIGVANRDDLRLAVIAHRDDKDELNRICEAAVTAAKEQDAAIIGTALHALTEQWDRGQLDLNVVPKEWRPDVEAYARATEGFEAVDIEQFGVIDDLKIGGTWDRTYRLRDGRVLLADTKSGNVTYGQGKIAMQLAVYSRCVPYFHGQENDRRRGVPNPERGIDQGTALVVHLPAGTGTCELYEVDITAGWGAVKDLAGPVRAWRARKNLFRPHENVPGGGDDGATSMVGGPDTGVQPDDAETNAATRDHIKNLIELSTTPAQVRGLWVEHKDSWDDYLSEIARHHIKTIT